jgi:catechol 2,3-dioxygenase-like lactoylglutathione lyase family enzyme
MPLKAIPVLPAKDFDETAEFYGRLGFTEHSRYPDYLILTRSEDLELHFWLNRSVDPYVNDVSCYVRWDTAAEARALHDEWATADIGADSLRAPVETDYGLLEFAMIDLNGNLLKVGGVVPADPAN